MNDSCRYMPRHADGTIRSRANQLFNRLTYDLWRRELQRFRRTQQNSRLRIVDIGCGPGFLLQCCEAWGFDAELIGVDQSEALLSVAKSRCKGMKALKGDVSSLPLQDQSVDVAFALHVVEHLNEPTVFFAEAHRILRPNGLLVIATPNSEGLGARVMGRRWNGYSDPTHVSLHGPSFWSDLVGESGFRISRHGTTGLTGIPLLNKMPLGLVHWIPSFIFGHFPWRLGEAYICVAVRT
jgi:SAM-dependent methyltransferase